jgi:H+/Cl- antiporter ClcA
MLRKIQSQTFIQATFWTAAAAVGTIAVIYARLINEVLKLYSVFFKDHPYIMTAATPVLFVVATYIVVKFGPEARGSGVPQVLQAISQTKNKQVDIGQNPLVSIRTMIVKIISSLVGFIAGASIGREGPTVQISASIFSWVSHKVKSKTSQIDPQSYIIAGAAAGIAAAFNTPLAGVTFAIEEIAEGVFWQFKRPVMFSIIIAGITAQAFVGDYLYFGHPATAKANWIVIPQALLIGSVCGLLGGAFARILVQKDFRLNFKHWSVKAFVCGLICSLIALYSNGESSGSGYEVVKQFMDSDQGQISGLFGLEKFISTIFSYFSGMAGGIFSPTLSIGAGIGCTLASVLGFLNLKTCALIGMVAFFSGVVQAPLTAVVIVMEMTDEHSLIIPFMIAAVVAQLVGKLVMPTPLYHFLAFGEKSEETHS